VSELQHPDSRSFEQVAGLYERVRPGYPEEILAWFADRLDLRGGRTVLDLGAGTGKLTRALVARGAEVIALEPGDEMRAELQRAVPEAAVLAAGAEAIPLPDGSVDAATAGQSFHWFRLDEAVPEVHRVLRPGAGLGLVWNMRDQDDELQREITDLLAPLVPQAHERERPGVATFFRHEAFEERGLFHGFEQREARFGEELDAAMLVGRISSISFVAAASAEERSKLQEKLREHVAARGGRVQFRYLTEALVTFAVA
jgi:SAM-dependent methyltransferase